MGIADNTIVVYVSDQGYFLGEHGFFDKRMFYEEAARMPFVIRYPKKIPAGKRLKDLILNVDFAPTLAEFAGVKMENVQGHSFTGNLEGKLRQTGGKKSITVTGRITLSARHISLSVPSATNSYSITQRIWT